MKRALERALLLGLVLVVLAFLAFALTRLPRPLGPFEKPPPRVSAPATIDSATFSWVAAPDGQRFESSKRLKIRFSLSKDTHMLRLPAAGKVTVQLSPWHDVHRREEIVATATFFLSSRDLRDEWTFARDMDMKVGLEPGSYLVQVRMEDDQGHAAEGRTLVDLRR